MPASPGLETGPPMLTVIDLTATTFIDASVIAELVAAHAANASHGFAIAANPNSHVARCPCV